MKASDAQEIPQLKVGVLVTTQGERRPLLVTSSGIPDWWTTLYVTVRVRNVSRAPNTQRNALDALQLLMQWGSINLKEQSLVEKMAVGGLAEHEVESLRVFLLERRSKKKNKRLERIKHSKNSSLPEKSEVAIVSQETLYNRLTTVANFLHFLYFNTTKASKSESDLEISDSIKRMLNQILNLRPQLGATSLVSGRMGMDNEEVVAILDIVSDANPSNPFEVSVRRRNKIIVELLLKTGIRAGELLNLKVSDFSFRENTITIARRHNELEDPRKKQPVVKTLDRVLPIHDELMTEIFDYLNIDRASTGNAHKHSYLFVVHKTGPHHGMPLNYTGLYKIFQKILRNTELSNSLSPHVFRHTKNDLLSQEFDQKGTSTAQEEKLRSYLMGWSEGSGTAVRYTKRHTQKEANKASLSMQSNLRARLKS